MSESIRDLDRLEDRIRQHRQVDKRPILIVEGPDDEAVLEPHLEGVVIFPADGKNSAYRAHENLHDWSVSDVWSLLDRDFDYSSYQNIGDHLFWYEGRDLEGMLVRLGVLSDHLRHVGSRSKLDGVGGANGLVERATATALQVADLRERNAAHSWGLPFSDVPLQKKVNKNDLTLSIDGYVQALVAACKGEISVAGVMEALKEVRPDDGYGPSGKDVIAICGVALRKMAGTLDASSTDSTYLAAQLRSAAALALSRSAWLSSLKERISQRRES